jgi:hypothetical protein
MVSATQPGRPHNRDHTSVHRRWAYSGDYWIASSGLYAAADGWSRWAWRSITASLRGVWVGGSGGSLWGSNSQDGVKPVRHRYAPIHCDGLVGGVVYRGDTEWRLWGRAHRTPIGHLPENISGCESRNCLGISHHRIGSVDGKCRWRK